MQILIFAGSTSLESLNRKLASQAAAIARAAGASVTQLELAGLNIPMYNADLEAQATPADVIELKQLMFSHPAWLVCSPEYNGSFTALLKNTIDWASSPIKNNPDWARGSKPFDGKVVGLLSASPGLRGGQNSLLHLSAVLRNLQCWVAPKQYALGHANQAFDAQGHLKDPLAHKSVAAVVEQVLWAAARLAP